MAHAGGCVTHLDLEPVAFLKRLAALLPAPYQNLVSYHGVFANRSRFRVRLPAPPPGFEGDSAARAAKGVIASGAGAETGDAHDADASELLALPPPRPPWARLLRRTLKVDGLDCPRCDAQMVLLAIITAASVIERICTHLRLPATPPTVASARSSEPAPELTFDSWDEPPEPDESPASGRARPPP